jgi:hypothetical protein
MIAEKQTAFSHPKIAGAYALLTGGPLEASCEIIKDISTVRQSQLQQTF